MMSIASAVLQENCQYQRLCRYDGMLILRPGKLTAKNRYSRRACASKVTTGLETLFHVFFMCNGSHCNPMS